MIVHLLVAGQPVCGFMPGTVPGDWPEDHKWTRPNQLKITCRGCMIMTDQTDDPNAPIFPTPASTHVLMSPQNPDGWELEKLLVKLQDEVRVKCLKIREDPRLIAKTVLNNNIQILGLLQQAQGIQQQSYALLDDMAPNEGPLGVPRIGEGS